MDRYCIALAGDKADCLYYSGLRCTGSYRSKYLSGGGGGDLLAESGSPHDGGFLDQENAYPSTALVGTSHLHARPSDSPIFFGTAQL